MSYYTGSDAHANILKFIILIIFKISIYVYLAFKYTKNVLSLTLIIYTCLFNRFTETNVTGIYQLCSS